MDTSGIQVTEFDDGRVELFYADYGVGMFGDGEFECTYYLNAENAQKLRAALEAQYTGSLQDMVVAAFTWKFKGSLFRAFCKEHDIDYRESFWSS